MTDDLQWYCVRAKPRTERMTSRLLRTETGMDVFCPFVSFERARRSGRVWVTEAMFPGYLFAHFAYPSQHRLVRSTHGVTSILGFGGQPAVVPEEIIRELRAAVKNEETVVIECGVEIGEEVNVVAGPFQGVRAVVTRVMPARQRVAVLLEVLGMEREVEVAVDTVLPDVAHPMVRAERRKG
jgi:transcriptional antiterminator RfaH